MPGLCCVAGEGFDESLLKPMIISMKHRDWYHVDTYIDSFCHFARVHLDIFNPEPQPVFNSDKSLCIFMDGKIYGYEEEKKRLQRKGYKFTADNDPEFCLHLYDELGNEFARKLNGSFVMIIYDIKKKAILIINDRYGLRPLYYTSNGKYLVAASEVKAIIKDKSFKKETNDEAVIEFLTYGGEITGNKTFFKGIEVLPPGSILSYHQGHFSIKQYWDFNYQPDYSITADEYAKQLAEIFKRAVNKRIEGKLRYGLMLSGGLDSRLIAAAIDREILSKIDAYTFGSPGCTEYRIARKVSKLLGMRHKFIEFDAERSINYSKEAVYITDAFDYVGIGATFFAYEKIVDSIDVSINGTPGDLTLGGGYIDRNIIMAQTNEELLLRLERRRILSDDIISKLFISDHFPKIKDMPIDLSRKAIYASRVEHPGNKTDYFFLQNRERRFTLMGDVLVRTSAETATPFYDNDFIDIILKTPPEWRINHRLFIKVLQRLSPELARITYEKTMLPADAPFFLWRPGIYAKAARRRFTRIAENLFGHKISSILGRDEVLGFARWMRNNRKWKNFTAELLLSEESLTRSYFNREFVRKLIKNQQKGYFAGVNPSQTERLAFLMTFELFLRMFAYGSAGNKYIG